MLETVHLIYLDILKFELEKSKGMSVCVCELVTAFCVWQEEKKRVRDGK